MAFSIDDITYNLGINESEQRKLQDVLQLLPTEEQGRENAYRNGEDVTGDYDQYTLKLTKNGDRYNVV